MNSNKDNVIPELLAPAGNADCLVSALDFGANAVYLGGNEFGMRAAPKNFSIPDMTKAVKLAHGRGVRVYLTCNTIPRNDEIAKLPKFLENACDCGIDALILTDLGVLSLAKKYAPGVEIHISTQFGVMNYESANMLYELGAKRIVASRELSLNDICEIRTRIPAEMEIECFVHGAMCVSFSGRCLISNYLVGRDSNRGDCSQPCRWKYSLMEETRPGEYMPVFENDEGTYIMNAKDLCMIEHIPELIKAGVNCFKIEGRAKSSYYTAVVTNAYRCAIDEWVENPNDNYKPSKWILDEIGKISYREYCTGFYYGHPKDNSQVFYDGGYRREWDVVAVAESYDGVMLTAIQRNRFFEGDEIEILEPGKKPFIIIVKNLQSIDGQEIAAAQHPMMIIKFECPVDVKKDAIIRKAK
ncbi:MAG: U32 family peptidase [Eubacteriales bacterium]